MFPVLVTLHSSGYCAIIGGYVVRDRALPALYGRYVYGDLCKPEIRSIMLSPRHATGDQGTGLSVRDMSSFGRTRSGTSMPCRSTDRCTGWRRGSSSG